MQGGMHVSLEYALRPDLQRTLDIATRVCPYCHQHIGKTQEKYKMTEEQIKEMVDRFLSWSLPVDFNPDGGISFSGHRQHGPTGTNLFTAAQADAMVRHMLEALE
jgi:hypothetical protein